MAQEDILTILPKGINFFKNKETDQSYVRFEYQDMKQNYKIDFDDFSKILDYVKRIGANTGSRDMYWKEYLQQMRKEAKIKEFFPEGISYGGGEYKYINEDEKEHKLPAYKTDEVKKGIKQLKKHEKITNIQDKRKFRTIIKWGLVSPFFFAVKCDDLRAGDDMIPYLFLTGQAKTAKTSHLKLLGDIYGVQPKGSQSIKTNFTQMKAFSESKNPLFIEESHSVFTNSQSDALVDMLKSNASSTKEVGARGLQTQEVNEYIGLRTMASSMNFDPGITDPGMRRRMVKIIFEPKDVVTKESKEAFMELKANNYIKNLKELFFYLQLLIIEELNKSDDSFLNCVDKVLKNEGLDEYTNVCWITDVDKATKTEEKLIAEEVYGLINSELSKNQHTDNQKLLESGYITGIRVKKNSEEKEYYATFPFVEWYNSRSRRFKITLRKLAGIIQKKDEIEPKVIKFNNKSIKSVLLDSSEIHELNDELSEEVEDEDNYAEYKEE